MARATLVRAAALALAAVAALVAAAAAPASACSCSVAPPFLDAVAASSLVVDVKVVETVFLPHPINEQGKKAVWSARLLRSYKGCAPSTIGLWSGANPALCGVRLTVGVRYVFILGAPNSDGNYRVSLCGRFRRWDDLSYRDQQALRKMRPNYYCPKMPQ
ncbi:hypothetical protein BU14_0076s0023 [Porphyra umbilicalis]|uniref:NTR domain-containing protein n=1 Tax=Porphyra umbilicalis TaxID=2786 RepID=A0A1X6PFF0_PORUM|nr:hypothetical protein BU14_0076s0023 [Porphyra umbilicalis]|eukprot:OSX79466.1 hypothetical protein BU14_0076s0023 [Porphyra umbilicalis]